MQRYATGVGLVLMVSLSLAASTGNLWQAALHMYYFTALAVLAGYCGRNVIVVAATLTVVHHLVLNYLAPALVFSSGINELGRAALHAAIVAVAAAALVCLTDYLAQLVARDAANLAEAEAARARIETLTEAQMAHAQQAAETRRALVQDLTTRFEESVGAIVGEVAAAGADLRAMSQAMVTAAGGSTRKSGDVAAASEAAARNVALVAEVTEQLTASIHAIADQITKAGTLIQDSVARAATSSEQVQA